MSTSLKLSRFFLFLAPFAVFIVSTTTLFPFIVGKYAFFRTCVDLSLMFFVWAWAFGKIQVSWKSLKKPLAIGVALWVLIFLLASFFAYDPWAAFWGNFERGEGGIQLLHFFIFFFLLAALLKNENDWQKMLKCTLGAAFLVILYGLLAGNVQGFIGPSFSLSTRFQGSLGNPDYIGQYMMFAIFFALYLFLNSLTKSRRMWYGVCAVIFFLFFLLSQTRGAFLGFAAGVFMVLIYLAFKAPRKKMKTVFAGVILLLIICLGLFIGFRHSPFIKNLPIVGRFSDISLQARGGAYLDLGKRSQGDRREAYFGLGSGEFQCRLRQVFRHEALRSS